MHYDLMAAMERARESLLTKMLLQAIGIHGPFFGIPQTYLAHIKPVRKTLGWPAAELGALHSPACARIFGLCPDSQELEPLRWLPHLHPP